MHALTDWSQFPAPSLENLVAGRLGFKTHLVFHLSQNRFETGRGFLSSDFQEKPAGTPPDQFALTRLCFAIIRFRFRFRISDIRNRITGGAPYRHRSFIEKRPTQSGNGNFRK